MSPKLSLVIDGKKFMWDGQVHAMPEESTGLRQAYEKDNFEVRVVEEDGQFLLYTRRVVQNVTTVQ